jgi:hypothetical protein
VRRLLALACLLALAGCGQSASSSAEFEGEERAVADVVEDLQSAGERRDGDRVCKEILAGDLVKALEQGGVDCADELDKALREADDSSLDVTDVQVSGTSATAKVTGKEGSDDRDATIELVKENGAWRVKALR